MSSSPTYITEKLANLQKQLNEGLVGKEDVIKTTLLTLIAGENIVLLGPSGSGKSLLSRRIASSFAPQGDTKDTHFFEHSLTKSTTQDDIFGISSENKRNTAGYMPSAQIAFLDDVFKASGSILNGLLSLLNEHVYQNGTEMQASKLQGVVGASHELPDTKDDLSSLYDRFLVRKFIHYLPNNKLGSLFDIASYSDISSDHKLTAQEIEQISTLAKSVIFPVDIKTAIQQIWQEHDITFKDYNSKSLFDRRFRLSEKLSDRRFIKSLNLLRISAVTNGRTEVNLSDVLLLKDILWNNSDNSDKVLNIILSSLHDFDKQINIDGNHEIHAKSLGYTSPVIKTDDEGSDTLEETKVIKKTALTPVIKGMSGSGTADDPILIENIQDFARLQEPDVGQQGYYFRQTSDLDFSPITENAWLAIDFTGHYDGNNYKLFRSNFSNLEVFRKVNNGSVTRLQIENMVLALHVVSSDIRHCISTESICDTANSSQIQSCYCHSTLVYNAVIATSISDCVIHLSNSTPTFSGHAISKKCENSSITNCYIYGTHDNYYNLVKECNSSEVKHCVVGNGLNYGLITTDHVESTFINNKYIVSDNDTLFTSEEAEQRCEPVSDILITQSYYEHTLGWSFDRIWEWDTENNHLKLQTATQVEDKVNNNTTSLLHQQMIRNIWL